MQTPFRYSYNFFFFFLVENVVYRKQGSVSPGCLNSPVLCYSCLAQHWRPSRTQRTLPCIFRVKYYDVSDVFSCSQAGHFDHLSLLSHNKNTITILQASDNRDGGNPLSLSLFSLQKHMQRCRSQIHSAISTCSEAE